MSSPIQEVSERTHDSVDLPGRTQNVIDEFCAARDIDRDEFGRWCLEMADKAIEDIMAQGGIGRDDLASHFCLGFHVGYEVAAKKFLREMEP